MSQMASCTSHPGLDWVSKHDFESTKWLNEPSNQKLLNIRGPTYGWLSFLVAPLGKHPVSGDVTIPLVSTRVEFQGERGGGLISVVHSFDVGCGSYPQVSSFVAQFLILFFPEKRQINKLKKNEEGCIREL